MTSANAAKPKPRGWFRFPDPPEIPDEKMTAFDHLSINGNAHFLAEHLGNPETTLVAGGYYLSLRFTRCHRPKFHQFLGTRPNPLRDCEK